MDFQRWGMDRPQGHKKRNSMGWAPVSTERWKWGHLRNCHKCAANGSQSGMKGEKRGFKCVQPHNNLAKRGPNW